MGHNMDVHREYYRLRESTVELTEVARLLCAIDEGSTVNIQGKKPSEINIEGKYDVSLFFKFTSNSEDWENWTIEISLKHWVLRSEDAHDRKNTLFVFVFYLYL